MIGPAVAAKVAIRAEIEAVIEAVHVARVPRITEKMIATVCRLKRIVRKKRKVTITLRNNEMKDVLKRKGIAKLTMMAVLERKIKIVEVANERTKPKTTAVLNRVHVPARVPAPSLVHVHIRVPLHVHHQALSNLKAKHSFIL